MSWMAMAMTTKIALTMRLIMVMMIIMLIMMMVSWCRLVGGDAAGGPFDPALSVIATNPPTHPLSPPTLSSHKYKHKYKYKCKCNRRNTISPKNPTLLLNNSKTNTSTIFLAHPHIVSLFLLQNTLLGSTAESASKRSKPTPYRFSL